MTSPSPHHGTRPIASSGSSAMVASARSQARRQASTMSSRSSSGAAHSSPFGSAPPDNHDSDSSPARPNTSPKYRTCVEPLCLTRPSRFVPVGVSGLRMSYSPSPSNFHTRISRASCKYVCSSPSRPRQPCRLPRSGRIIARPRVCHSESAMSACDGSRPAGSDARARFAWTPCDAPCSDALSENSCSWGCVFSKYELVFDSHFPC